MARRLVALFLVVSLLLAGCTAADSKSEPSAAPTSAAPVSVTADLGSITGVVVSDEAVPIPGADVAVLPLGLATKTDPAGLFTFNDVDPGEYTLHASALGFESSARKVKVVAGEATEARFALKAIAVSEDVFVTTFPLSFFINFGWWGSAEWLTVLQPYLCDPCQVYRHVQPKPGGGLIEMDWKPSVSGPIFSKRAGVGIYAAPRNDTTSAWTLGTYIAGAAGPPRTAALFAETGVKAMKKVDFVMIRAYAAYNDSIMVQQRLNMWMSLAYNGEVPENFTAMPPV